MAQTIIGSRQVSLGSGWNVMPTVTRTRSGQYMVSTFRTLGTAATPQNIFTITNPAGSGFKVAIKELEIMVDSTAVLATVSPTINVSRPTALPTGGTTLATFKSDTTHPNTTVVCRGGTASDGGAATAITATAGTLGWRTYVDRLHTAVGYVQHIKHNLLPSFIQSEPIILQAGESILVQAILANAATTHFIVNCAFEEYV